MRRKRVRLGALFTVLGCAVALVSMSPAVAGASPAPTNPPMGPSAVHPNAGAAPLVTGEHIVKRTTGPSCTGYYSQTTPPATIRVLITSGTPHIVTVPFESYVENVLPNEWIPSWDNASLQAGAVAVKSYGWFWVNHYGGYLGNTASSSTCFDVDDTGNFQVYQAGSATQWTNSAVQSTWSVVARDADTHTVRQTFYICSLPYNGSCGGDAKKCGAGANGSQLSQYGSQACAVAGENYVQILRTYYYQTATSSALELATIQTQPVSAPAAGPVALRSDGTLIAFRISGGNVLSSGQSWPGSTFGPWGQLSNPGTTFVGQPTALLASNGALVVYARTSNGALLGAQQSSPGGAFTPWTTIGGTPTSALVTDPAVLVGNYGALVAYAIGADGNVWGSGQSRAGSAFSGWGLLSSKGGYSGKPAAVFTSTRLIALYARKGATIQGSSQSSPGGLLSNFQTIGSGTLSATGDPVVFQANDGTLSLVVGAKPGSVSGIWASGQPAPGTAFGPWQQISGANTTFVSGAAAHALAGGTVVVYATSSNGTVQGAQAPSPASVFSTFRAVGTGTPNAVGPPSLAIAANGALVLYAMGADGNLWGSGQSRPGSAFSAWLLIGS